MGLSHDIMEEFKYSWLSAYDEESNHLKSDAISIIASSLSVNKNEIVDIEVLKKGMTNRSFLFCCRDKRYIMRIPGEGTDQFLGMKKGIY